jgi:hypothetical protein
VFVKHALPKGEMTHRGKPVDPAKIRRVALMTVEGENDDISGVGQTEAAHGCAPTFRRHRRRITCSRRRPLRRVQRLALPLRDRAAHQRFHAVPHRIVHRAGERGTVWTETRDSGERILCVAGDSDTPSAAS